MTVCAWGLSGLESFAPPKPLQPPDIDWSQFAYRLTLLAHTVMAALLHAAGVDDALQELLGSLLAGVAE